MEEVGRGETQLACWPTRYEPRVNLSQINNCVGKMKVREAMNFKLAKQPGKNQDYFYLPGSGICIERTCTFNHKDIYYIIFFKFY